MEIVCSEVTYICFLCLQMPGTVEELEANLEQASSILLLNQNVVAEYEMRQRKIEALARTLEEEEHGLRTLLAEIDALKINGTFGHNFQEMAIAREVLLDEHDMDFGAYGIVIKVKFRGCEQSLQEKLLK
ncbi:structural maintenance of chromosomes protein 5 isoform X2 [Spinacia oleracea]|uniref:Structural maintenance of chromosomes protein 5 isoform X2 n=1 Tax=Spinacia oleracea TaxID=3562 RepID=A0ABM3RVX1_SPIOL|nr:structural maintenance of chromosomes protein 5-like isoform X2 [Spinacia oleracea]